MSRLSARSSSRTSKLASLTPVAGPSLARSLTTTPRSLEDKALIDKKIPYKIVQLVDPVTGVLGPPRPLLPLLEEIKKRNEERHKEAVAALLAKKEEERKKQAEPASKKDGERDKQLEPAPKNDEAKRRPAPKKEKQEPFSGDICVLVSSNPAPIVKIVNKRAALERQKAEKLRAKQNKRVQKVIQMTWGVELGDLTHKVAKMRDELGAGNHVELVMTKKKGVPVPKPLEMEKKVNQVVEMMKDVAREIGRNQGAMIWTVSLRPFKEAAKLTVGEGAAA